MMIGILQEKIIEIGKKRGYVTPDDVKKFYLPNQIQMQMNKLIVRGFFKEEYDGIKIKWIYIEENK